MNIISIISVLFYTSATSSYAFQVFNTLTPSFSTKKIYTTRSDVLLYEKNRDNSSIQEEETKVKVGSKEYFSGFIERDLNQEPNERVSGDKLLGPTFKFVGGFTVIISLLLLGFMASNGLL